MMFKTVENTHLMIPSSSPFGNGLYKESIISTFGDCVRTDALYLETKGQHLEPTTWKFQNISSKVNQAKKFQVYDTLSQNRSEKKRKEENVQQLWMGYLIDLETHEKHPFPRS